MDKVPEVIKILSEGIEIQVYVSEKSFKNIQISTLQYPIFESKVTLFFIEWLL